MTQEVDRGRLWRIFDAVKELPAQEQEGALAELCAGDEQLAEELRALLSPLPSSFLEGRALALPVSAEKGPPYDGDFEPGRVLDGKYVLHERIGAGSMGAVYRGEHLQLRKRVAIKLLHTSPGASEEALARMVREAAAVAAVRHENVVAVHDVGVHEGRAYMVMDWIEGVDLHKWLVHAQERHLFHATPESSSLRAFFESALGRPCTGPLWSRPYWEVVAFVAARIARAVDSAHASGFVHRDIAPKNILLTADGRPYLVDFGVAVLAGDVGTRTAGLAGTLPYMAPEQLEVGTLARQPGIDVYGIGATLYHLAVGRTPFEGQGMQLCARIRRSLPPSIRALRPDAPRDLAAICFAAMEKRPEARYAGAGALADDLEAFLERRPVSRRPPNAAGRVVRWCQRRPASALAVGALAASLVGFSSAGVFAHRESERRAEIQRAQDFAQLFAKLPALVTLDADARYRSPPETFRLAGELDPDWDELVRLDPELPLLRWYRANWNSQRGNLEKVRVDIEALRGAGHGSAVLEALAGPLASSDPIERNQLIAPGELPAAASAFDQALIAYVAIRWRDYSTAWRSLGVAIDAEPEAWIYRDLRAVAGLESASADLCFEDAVRVEAALGNVATCRTLHVRAVLLRPNDPVRSAELWKECLKLGGDQHQPLHNLGRLRCDEGDYAGAVDFLQRAARPGAWRTSILLSRCAENQGHFEEAQRALDEGLEDLPEGMPLEHFSPVQDLDLERASMYVAWASRLAREGAGEEAEQRLNEATRLLDPLVKAGSTLAAGPRLEIQVMQLAVDLKLGRRSRSETISAMRSLHLDFMRLRDPHRPSEFIAATLGLLLAQAGGESSPDVEGLLLCGLGEPTLKAEIEEALKTLAGG